MEKHDERTLHLAIHRATLCGPLFSTVILWPGRPLIPWLIISHPPNLPYFFSHGVRVPAPHSYAASRLHHRTDGFQRLTPMQHCNSSEALVGSSTPLLCSIAVAAPHWWAPAPHSDAVFRFQRRTGGFQRPTPMQHCGSSGAMVGSTAYVSWAQQTYQSGPLCLIGPVIHSGIMSRRCDQHVSLCPRCPRDVSKVPPRAPNVLSLFPK